jgi:hypothetical protein
VLRVDDGRSFGDGKVHHPVASSLHEWIADEKGYFTAEGLDYEFQPQSLAGRAKQTSTLQSADEVPAEVRSGAFEDMSAGRACDVSSACHWAVNGVTAAGAGKMWGMRTTRQVTRCDAPTWTPLATGGVVEDPPSWGSGGGGVSLG